MIATVIFWTVFVFTLYWSFVIRSDVRPTRQWWWMRPATSKRSTEEKGSSSSPVKLETFGVLDLYHYTGPPSDLRRTYFEFQPIFSLGESSWFDFSLGALQEWVTYKHIRLIVADTWSPDCTTPLTGEAYDLALATKTRLSYRKRPFVHDRSRGNRYHHRHDITAKAAEKADQYGKLMST